MTEKEAWLEIAEMFDSDEPMPLFKSSVGTSVIGLCQATRFLSNRGAITRMMENRMDERMSSHFRGGQYKSLLWPENTERATRSVRATACGLLAAMCDD